MHDLMFAKYGERAANESAPLGGVGYRFDGQEPITRKDEDITTSESN